MGLEIVRYTDDHKAAWDDLVEASINTTFLHSRSFYNHNPLNRADDCSFLFYKKSKLVAAIGCALYREGDKLILQSHLRATYGGFIITNSIGTQEAVEMVEALIDEAKKLNVVEIVIRNPFRIFNRAFCDETDYAMWYHGFKIRSRELEYAISLMGDFAAHYNDTTRRNINKAIKNNVQVTETGSISNFWKILEATLNDRHKVKPVHNLEEINALIQNVGEGKIKLFSAVLGEVEIGGILVFIANANVLHAQYIASDILFQEHRPLNVVINFINAWAKERGFKYFNLGMASEKSGQSINEGLTRFKEGFGARGVLRETMYLQINN